MLQGLNTLGGRHLIPETIGGREAVRGYCKEFGYFISVMLNKITQQAFLQKSEKTANFPRLKDDLIPFVFNGCQNISNSLPFFIRKPDVGFNKISECRHKESDR